MPDWLKKLLAWLAAALVAPFPPAPAPTPAPAPDPAPAPPPAPQPPLPVPDPAEPPPSTTWVFKPISDNDGNLAVVTGCDLELRRVVVTAGRGKTTREEAGRLTSRANGDRQHWRFLKPGRAYGRNLRVVVYGYSLKTGEDVSGTVWKIPNGALRYEWRR